MAKVPKFEGLCGKICRGSLVREEDVQGRGDGECVKSVDYCGQCVKFTLNSHGTGQG